MTLIHFFFRIIRKSRFLIHETKVNYLKRYYFYISKGNFNISTSVTLGKNFSIHNDLSNPKLQIGVGTRFRENCKLRIEKNGIFIIGDNCFFNNNFSATCLLSITIGDNSQFGENVLIYDSNHRFSSPEALISGQGYNVSPVRIGNNCWIGSNVIILKGVVIGDNVVIGAGCTIYKSVEDNSMVINKQNLTIKKYR